MQKIKMIGTKTFAVCAGCGDIVQLNKRFFGSAHICAPEDASQELINQMYDANYLALHGEEAPQGSNQEMHNAHLSMARQQQSHGHAFTSVADDLQQSFERKAKESKEILLLEYHP